MIETELPTAFTVIIAERTLGLVAAAYQAQPDSPLLLSEFNQVFWSVKKNVMGVSGADLVVADCPYSADGIRGFMWHDCGLFVPQILSTAPEGLILLGRAFPRMCSWAFEKDTTVLNIDHNGQPIELDGWMRGEKGLAAPYLETSQRQAEDIIRKSCRRGHTLNIYAVAGQQSKLLEGQYLDAGKTWIRVLSSRYRGLVLDAYFGPDGHCHVGWSLKAADVSGDLGARSVEVANLTND